ncbi:DNA mismatch repair protein Msh6 [Auricularia subglabra TFB-10046 SS5]|nr:DNA mismatch repair protein Msh6 [Auricularia subglabra TFB-10046 SS5]
MLSDNESIEVEKPRLSRLKRKADVDSELEEESFRSSSSEAGDRPSSPTTKLGANRRTKRPRPSMLYLDEDEDEEPAQPQKKVTKKKTAAKKKRNTSDDDFLAPSGEESDKDVEVGVPSDVDDDVKMSEDDEPVSKPKTKAKAAPKKVVTAAPAAGGDGGDLFMTAAERRVQTKKDGKKEQDECFSFLKDVRDKDGRAPSDPDYDPRTIYIPKSAWKSFTPFERQFWEIKQNQYDTVLFFQKGKFFELYENDARIGHQEFDLKLTERVKMCMVGVPEQSFDFWAVKFLMRGHKVGKVMQDETALGAEMRLAKTAGAKSKEDKIVRRVLNQVFTLGTLVDPLDEEAGHCVSVVESGDGRFGVCVLDCSTSEFNMASFEDDPCRTKLETVLRRTRVKEMLGIKGNLTSETTRLLKTVLPGNCLWTWQRSADVLSYEQTLQALKELYPQPEDAMEEDEYAGVPQSIRTMLHERAPIEALGATIAYLRQLNLDKNILSMRNFNVLDPMRKGVGLLLDGQTLAHLEVLSNSDGTAEGSLLDLLGRCVTPFGKRLFRMWLCAPLREAATINDRLDAVEDLMDHPSSAEQFAKLAKGVPDLERLLTRIHAGKCKVKDFLKVLLTFLQTFKGLNDKLADLENAAKLKAPSLLRLFKSVPDLTPHVTAIEEMYALDDDSLLPASGKDETYDQVIEEIEDIEGNLERKLDKFADVVGTKLTYWHSAQGQKEIYIVQVPAAKTKKVPSDWVQTNSTKAMKRYDVPDLAPLIRKLKEARENRTAAINSFKSRVFAAFDADRGIWLRAVRMLAELDCLFSLAKASEAIGATCRPEIVESDVASVEFKNLKHPALCLKRDEFIPNDVALGGSKPRVMLLTGPNMGGKSTLMRMTAAGVIMAQLGMLLPADSARISPVDAIMTRMGAYDNMFSNSSTFKVELDECCKILKEASPKSLVILDELGRGTSTYDGMAIAGAVLHEIATHTLALSCFATHYSSLTDDYAYHPQIRNMHMATRVDDERRELVFLYKLVDGVATGSFGTHVASLAGVPSDVVERAEVISIDFAAKFKKKIEGKSRSALPLPVQADFAYLAKLVSGLSLPDDSVRQREVLSTIRKTAAKLCAA